LRIGRVNIRVAIVVYNRCLSCQGIIPSAYLSTRSHLHEWTVWVFVVYTTMGAYLAVGAVGIQREAT